MASWLPVPSIISPIEIPQASPATALSLNNLFRNASIVSTISTCHRSGGDYFHQQLQCPQLPIPMPHHVAQPHHSHPATVPTKTSPHSSHDSQKSTPTQTTTPPPYTANSSPPTPPPANTAQVTSSPATNVPDESRPRLPSQKTCSNSSHAPTSLNYR